MAISRALIFHRVSVAMVGLCSGLAMFFGERAVSLSGWTFSQDMNVALMLAAGAIVLTFRGPRHVSPHAERLKFTL